jgi:hypothetical protein
MIIYLSITPVYWLPTINTGIISFFKISLITFLLFIFFYFTLKEKIFLKLKVPILFILTLLIILVFFPFFFYNSIENNKTPIEILNYYLNFLFGLLTFFVFANIDYKVINLNKLKIPFIVVSFLCLFPIFNFIFDIPNWISPFTLESGNLLDTFWSTGFNASRTGWSGSIALYLPLALAFNPFFSVKSWVQKKNKLIFVFFILLLPIFASQCISLGRAGILASFFSILLIVFYITGFKGILKFICVAMLFLLPFKNEVLVAMRISDTEGNVLELNEISAARADMNKEAPYIFFQNPFFGQGYDGSRIALKKMGGSKYYGLEVHNTYLNLLIDHGLFVALAFIILVFQILKISFHLFFTKEIPLFILANICIIISGIIISLFEPKAIFVSYQQGPLWWMAAGINYQYYLANKNYDSKAT